MRTQKTLSVLEVAHNDLSSLLSAPLSLSLSLSSSTMAGAAENSSSVVAAAAAADEVEFGFERPEMYKGKLAGTVDPYDRHVFLCYKSYDSWPSRVEESDSDSLPKLLSGALKARKNDIKVKVSFLD